MLDVSLWMEAQSALAAYVGAIIFTRPTNCDNCTPTLSVLVVRQRVILSRSPSSVRMSRRRPAKCWLDFTHVMIDITRCVVTSSNQLKSIGLAEETLAIEEFF